MMGLIPPFTGVLIDHRYDLYGFALWSFRTFFLTSDSCHPRFFILTDLKTTSVFRPVWCRRHCFVVSHPTTGWHPSRPCFHFFHHSTIFRWMYLHVRKMCTTPFWARPSSFFFFGCRWTTKQPWCALPIPLCGMLAAVVPSGHHATGSCWKHAPVMLPLMEVPKERRLSVWREPEKSEGTEENLWVAGRFGASPKNDLSEDELSKVASPTLRHQLCVLGSRGPIVPRLCYPKMIDMSHPSCTSFQTDFGWWISW